MLPESDRTMAGEFNPGPAGRLSEGGKRVCGLALRRDGIARIVVRVRFSVRKLGSEW
jgi:hypothetical protein